jgi:hypothetical protein
MEGLLNQPPSRFRAGATALAGVDVVVDVGGAVVVGEEVLASSFGVTAEGETSSELLLASACFSCTPCGSTSDSAVDEAVLPSGEADNVSELALPRRD